MNVSNHSPQAESHPRVSWLLCTHREDDLLHRAIRSCLAQTMNDFELLLIVNGAQANKIVDSLKKTYGSDARVRIISTPVRLLNFSLSLGLHLAKAPLVARMDADDVSHPERLLRQVEFMDTHEQVVVLGSSYTLIDPNGHEHGRVDPPNTNDEICKALRFRNPICHPSVMLRRAAILEVGGYLGGQNAEDYDLWLRICIHPQWQFANLKEPLLAYNVALTGEARRSRVAYANVAAAQLRQLLVSGDLRWLVGAMLTAAKSVVSSARA